MNDTKEKITPLKNVEEQEKLKMKYEEEAKAAQEQITSLENKITKKNDEIFELQKVNKNLATERDDWKKEAHSARKVYKETKQHKEAQDFEQEFIKSQEKKGIKWNGEKWINQ